MDSNLKKLEDENYQKYIYRIDGLIRSGIYTNWSSVADIVNKELYGDDEDKYKTESAFRKACKYARDFKEAGVFDNSDDYLEELKIQKRELEKERKKIQTEKLEYNKYLREEARDELIIEKYIDAVNTLKPLSIPNYIEPKLSNKSYCLIFGDCHDGIDFKINDMFGNTINEYSPKILENRMWDMLNKTIKLIKDKDIQALMVLNLGDDIQGILRLNSQLKMLKLGIIDSTIHFSELLANFLNELSKYTRVKYQSVADSNHNQLRICSAPKNSFPEENVSKLISWHLKTRLKDNENIKIIENPTGMCYCMMSGYSLLGIHGEVKNLNRAIEDFSRAYNTRIDYLVGAHIHHGKSEDVGYRAKTISIKSICGVDPYAMSLQKNSDAGASLFTFDQIYGLVCEDMIILN